MSTFQHNCEFRCSKEQVCLKSFIDNLATNGFGWEVTPLVPWHFILRCDYVSECLAVLEGLPCFISDTIHPPRINVSYSHQSVSTQDQCLSSVCALLQASAFMSWARSAQSAAHLSLLRLSLKELSLAMTPPSPHCHSNPSHTECSLVLPKPALPITAVHGSVSIRSLRLPGFFGYTFFFSFEIKTAKPD